MFCFSAQNEIRTHEAPGGRNLVQAGAAPEGTPPNPKRGQGHPWANPSAAKATQGAHGPAVSAAGGAGGQKKPFWKPVGSEPFGHTLSRSVSNAQAASGAFPDALEFSAAQAFVVLQEVANGIGLSTPFCLRTFGILEVGATRKGLVALALLFVITMVPRLVLRQDVLFPLQDTVPTIRVGVRRFLPVAQPTACRGRT